MKKNYVTLVLATLFLTTALGQQVQKNFINYQGVARSADSQLMASEGITINIGLRFGAANAPTVYKESHSIMTDANGVFSLLIGNGSAVTGNYNALPWGSAATFATVEMNGVAVGTTEMMAVPYAISSGDAKQSAAQVPYDNSGSGLSATTAQAAIDALAGGGTIDADDQALVLTGDLLTIQDGAGSVDLSMYREDADADINNELQTLDFDPATNALSLSDGNTVIIPSGGTDADADPTNEFQTLSFDVGTNQLSLSDGNVVTIPSGGADADADPENEIDVTRRHGLLVGDDGIVDGLVGTADGQVAKWDAALGNWVAGIDATGVGGSGSATGFEVLDQGSGFGWRLINRDPAYYGPIGLNALDASTNGIISTTRGATGFSATAMGEETTASGPRSTAMGYGAKATGSVSTAIGEETEASGEFAVAMGDRTLASDQSSTAFGSGTRAINTHATALGEGTTASGKSATSMGMSTKAESLGSLAIGRNNIGGGDPFVWQPNDPLFEIGNGSDALANNALTILKNGKVGIGTANPANLQHLHSDTARTDMILTNGATGELVSDGLQIGIKNDLGEGLVGYVMNEENGPLSFGTNSNTRMFIASGGFIGINTFHPGYRLDVDGDIRSTDLAGVGQRNIMADADGKLIVGASGGGSSLWTQNGNDVYLIDGDVGIGTTNPNAKLHVDGFILSQDLSGLGLRNVMADEDGRLVEGIGGGGSLWSQTGSDIYFNLGKVGIGLTDPNAMHQLHSATTESFTHFTTETTGKSLNDGLSVGIVDDFNSEIMNHEKSSLNLGSYGSKIMTVHYSGRVGIGDDEPESLLDVDGAIRSRDLIGGGNVIADISGNLIIGTGEGGSSQWTDDATGISYNSGNVGIGTTSSPSYPLSINTDSARPINLKTLGTDNYMAFNNSTGYIGYSGIFTGDKDMDFGTGFLNGTGKVHLVTNANPKLTVVANGDVGIGTMEPMAKLDVKGDIKTNGEIHASATGAANMLPRAYGRIEADGSITSGTGNFTVNRVIDGVYVIDLPGATNEGEWVVVANAMDGLPRILSIGYFPGAPRRFSVKCWNLASTNVNVRFNFVVYRR